MYIAQFAKSPYMMAHPHLQADPFTNSSQSCFFHELNFDEPSPFGSFNDHKGCLLFNVNSNRATFVERVY